MTISTTVCLLNREINRTFGQSSSMKILESDAIKKNIAQDIFDSYEHCLGSDSSYVSRNRQYISYYRRSEVVLYDLFQRKIIWSCEFETPQGEYIRSIQVSRYGKVFIITIHATKMSYFPYSNTCHIFSDGKKQGIIDLQSVVCVDHAQYYKIFTNMQMIGDRFLSFSTNCCENKIYIWDEIGSKIDEIEIDRFENGDFKIFASNRNFYVLIAEPVVSINPIKIFVLDLITGKKNLFEFDQNKKFLTITSATLKENILFCGVDYKDSEEKYIGSEILELNVISGKIEKKCPIKCIKGLLKHIKVSNKYILFAACVREEENKLLIINRIGDINQINEVLTCQEESLFLDCSFSGDLLNICFSNREMGWPPRHLRYLFDILELRIVKTVSYRRITERAHIQEEISLKKNILVIIDRECIFDDGVLRYFYVEDFLQKRRNSVAAKKIRYKWRRGVDILPISTNFS